MADYSHYKRPRRLSDATHALCKRALDGEFGKAMAENYCAIVEPEGYAEKDVYSQFSCCIRAIVEQAPIRLIDGELLAGSGTLDKARAHEVPAAIRGEDPTKRTFMSHSHLTPHFQKILKKGLRGLEQEIAKWRAVYAKRLDSGDRLHYLDVLQENVDHIKFWHQRNLDAIDARIAETDGEGKERWQQVRKNLTRVPYEPAENFREAIQSLWFVFVFLRLTGNWSAVGRFDWMLGPYLKKDLESGVITLDEAREYVAHFWIKGCEWVDLEAPIGHPDGAGDGQFYQNVVLSGKDAEGNDETNEVTYLVLEVLEELGIADYPTSVRISSDSPEKLIRKVAEVTRYGGGLIAVYNNDMVVDSLVKFGFAKEEACCFANDGCWEVQVPGKTCFCYWPWDVLATLQQKVLRLGTEGKSALPYETFDQLFAAYREILRQEFYDRTNLRRPFRPNPVISLFVEDCIGQARDYGDYNATGAVYRVDSPHAGGIVDAANALQAIKHVVFDEKMMSLNEFMDIVKADWEGHEELRLQLRTGLTYYGNGDEKGDAMMKRLYDTFIEVVESRPFWCGKLFPAGISTFGRQVTPEFLDHRTANPDGHKKGEFLSNNISPTPGTDLRGATATLRSYGGLDMSRLPGGTALEIKMSNATVRGDDGLDGLVDLLYAFCDLGCHFMQLDVVDAELLKKAYADPDAYGTLVVRVSGWSSRFRTLQRQWQQMVVERTEMGY